LFWNEILHVLDIFSVHHRELFTVHSAMVYVMQVCRQLSSSSRIRMELQFHRDPALYKPVWHIPLLSVQWITPDDGQRNCPKHVEFHSKIKFEKLVHLVNFIIRKFVTMHGHMNLKKLGRCCSSLLAQPEWVSTANTKPGRCFDSEPIPFIFDPLSLYFRHIFILSFPRIMSLPVGRSSAGFVAFGNLLSEWNCCYC
jgi:hypothetical protein